MTELDITACCNRCGEEWEIQDARDAETSAYHECEEEPQ